LETGSDAAQIPADPPAPRYCSCHAPGRRYNKGGRRARHGMPVHSTKWAYPTVQRQEIDKIISVSKSTNTLVSGTNRTGVDNLTWCSQEDRRQLQARNRERMLGRPFYAGSAEEKSLCRFRAGRRSRALKTTGTRSRRCARAAHFGLVAALAGVARTRQAAPPSSRASPAFVHARGLCPDAYGATRWDADRA